MTDLSINFNLNDLSWTISEIEKQEGIIIRKAYFSIEQEHETRSYNNVKYGIIVKVDSKIIQNESFEEDVDITIPTKLDINKTIALLLQPEKVHDAIFWIEIGEERYTYSYIISTMTSNSVPAEPVMVPDYELN